MTLNSTQRFVLAGLAATCFMASISSIFITRYLNHGHLETISQRATDVVSHLVTPLVSADDFDLKSASEDMWTQRLEKLNNVASIEEVIVRKLDGTIIHGSDQTMIGERFVPEAMKAAIASRRAVSALRTSPKGVPMLEIYVPVIPEGATEPIGVYSICEVYGPLAIKMRQTGLTVWVLSFLIFGIMFFALLAALSASRKEEMAYYDPLTKLANRHLFQKQAEKTLSLSRRSDASAILYMDLSRFKTVNDSLGQSAGDDILKQAALRLVENIRKDDMAARLGGDEFALLLSNVSSGERAIQIAKRLQEQFSRSFRTHGQDVHLDINIGIALLGKDKLQTVGTWLTQANTAMLKSKADHSEFQVYNPEMQSYTLERLQLEAGLREALEKQEFVLHYQPIVNKQQKIVGAEALVRWMHPEKGMISPGVFIPLAEETGFIRSLDQWVMKTAIKQARHWEEQGTALKVSVNLSPQTFQDDDFVDWLESQLIESLVTPNLIMVEITEYVLAHHDTSRKSLEALKHLGVRIALDDFGKGYSSLAYLENLPIDRIKIDRQFIQGIGKRSTSEAITKTIITLTKNLSIESLAEGIEEPEQFAWLCAEGCEFYQGFLFSQPLPVERFPSLYDVFATDVQILSTDIHLN